MPWDTKEEVVKRLRMLADEIETGRMRSGMCGARSDRGRYTVGVQCLCDRVEILFHAEYDERPDADAPVKED